MDKVCRFRDAKSRIPDWDTWKRGVDDNKRKLIEFLEDTMNYVYEELKIQRVDDEQDNM